MECYADMNEAKRLGNVRNPEVEDPMQKKTGGTARRGGGKPQTAAAHKTNNARTPGGALSAKPQEAGAMQEETKVQNRKIEDLSKGISYLERAYDAMRTAYDKAFDAACSRKEGERLFNMAKAYFDEETF